MIHDDGMTFFQRQRALGGPLWFVIVAWRALWIIPAYASRLLFCGIMCLGWGVSSAKDAWERTS